MKLRINPLVVADLKANIAEDNAFAKGTALLLRFAYNMGVATAWQQKIRNKMKDIKKRQAKEA